MSERWVSALGRYGPEFQYTPDNTNPEISAPAIALIKVSIGFSVRRVISKPMPTMDEIANPWLNANVKNMPST
jgi:hypothetical protein